MEGLRSGYLNSEVRAWGTATSPAYASALLVDRIEVGSEVGCMRVGGVQEGRGGRQDCSRSLTFESPSSPPVHCIWPGTQVQA